MIEYAPTAPTEPPELQRFQALTRTVPLILILLLVGAVLSLLFRSPVALLPALILLIAVLIGFASTARGLNQWANTHLYLALPPGELQRLSSDHLYPLHEGDADEINRLRVEAPETMVLLPARLSLNPTIPHAPTRVRAGDLAPLRRNQGGLLGLMN